MEVPKIKVDFSRCKKPLIRLIVDNVTSNQVFKIVPDESFHDLFLSPWNDVKQMFSPSTSYRVKQKDVAKVGTACGIYKVSETTVPDYQGSFEELPSTPKIEELSSYKQKTDRKHMELNSTQTWITADMNNSIFDVVNGRTSFPSGWDMNDLCGKGHCSTVYESSHSITPWSTSYSGLPFIQFLMPNSSSKCFRIIEWESQKMLNKYIANSIKWPCKFPLLHNTLFVDNEVFEELDIYYWETVLNPGEFLFLGAGLCYQSFASGPCISEGCTLFNRFFCPEDCDIRGPNAAAVVLARSGCPCETGDSDDASQDDEDFVNYQEEIDNMEEELSLYPSDDEDEMLRIDGVTAIVEKYAKRIMLPKKYWEECGEGYNLDEYLKIQHFVINHFGLLVFEFDDDTIPAFYLMDVDRFEFNVWGEYSISFPHKNIFWTSCWYKKKTLTHHPPKEFDVKCQELAKMYSEIKAGENDTEEWFKLLLSVDHDNFLRANVEYRLGEKLQDKCLWKLYISYLKEVDPKAMLVVYSKYVRFFTDDKEMLSQYKSGMKEYGPVSLFWDNLMGFEMPPPDFEIPLEDVEMKSEADEDETDNFDPTICNNFWDNMDYQRFCVFHTTTIDHILKNASPATLQKLFKSGKYFFYQKPTPICYRLCIDDDVTEFIDECVELNFLDLHLMQKVYVSSTIRANWDSEEEEDAPELFKNSVSRLIPFLSGCGAEFVDLEEQILSFEDFKFLVGSGNCVELKMGSCQLKDENGEFVDFEKIMKLLPNVQCLELPTVKFNRGTMESLATLPSDTKIVGFTIKKIVGEEFNIEKFGQFLGARMAKKIDIDLHFDPSYGLQVTRSVYQTLYGYDNPGHEISLFVGVSNNS